MLRLGTASVSYAVQMIAYRWSCSLTCLGLLIADAVCELIRTLRSLVCACDQGRQCWDWSRAVLPSPVD
jgi:hypothetical protein